MDIYIYIFSDSKKSTNLVNNLKGYKPEKNKSLKSKVFKICKNGSLLFLLFTKGMFGFGSGPVSDSGPRTDT